MIATSGHSVVVRDGRHRNECAWGSGQSDEPRGSRFWPHHRWRRHHRGEHAAAHRRTADSVWDDCFERDERLAEVRDASVEMVRPTVYGQIVIFLVFVPCLSFQGVEGKMFSPMVITLMLALASAFVAVADVRSGDGGDSCSRQGRGTRGCDDSRGQAPLCAGSAKGPCASSVP